MIKSELVLKIAEANPHLYQRDIENIVNAILDEIANAMANGDRPPLWLKDDYFGELFAPKAEKAAQ